jgi:hypothetical protein
MRPTPQPTPPCNQDRNLRKLLIRVLLNAVSNANAIMTSGTPQNRAFNWIVDQDAKFLCPNDATLQQRYALAVFYYSTRGDGWLDCNAPTDFAVPGSSMAANALCDLEPFPNSGSDAWLTPGDECQWGGVVCDENGIVRVLDLGTFRCSCCWFLGFD